MKTIMTVIGTRPEAIKLLPIIIALRENKYFENKVCLSGQHTDLVDSVLVDNNIQANYKIGNHKTNGSLHNSAAYMLERFGIILKETNPELLIVQGDTTTAFTAALAAFYLQIPIAHVEAGLRTGDLYSPWPEEAHRCLIDNLTTYFFAPTKEAQDTLIGEGRDPKKIWVVGNTSIDAVKSVQKTLKFNKKPKDKIIVVTVHRRENYGNPLREICYALLSIAQKFPYIKIIFCLHPNPTIRELVIKLLSGKNNIELVLPMSHHSFIRLLYESIFIITDSGGIQEEASFIGKPVLIVRDTTERPEIVKVGNAKLVGASSISILDWCELLLSNQKILDSMSKVHFSYGDGFAARRIVNILELNFKR